MVYAAQQSTEIGGNYAGSPMVGASLNVYYFPSVISAGTQLQLMGSATSDATGTATVTLDTSMVPAGDLGDNGARGE
jgi:hypothetical protein